MIAKTEKSRERVLTKEEKEEVKTEQLHFFFSASTVWSPLDLEKKKGREWLVPAVKFLSWFIFTLLLFLAGSALSQTTCAASFSASRTGMSNPQRTLHLLGPPFRN